MQQGHGLCFRGRNMQIDGYDVNVSQLICQEKRCLHTSIPV